MKKSIWIKGSEIREMTTKQMANYEFNVRTSNPDEPSNHELLLLLVKEVKDIKAKLKEYDQLFRDHGWIK